MTHHYFHNKYLIEAQKLLQILSLEEKSFSQTSPSNIALIKYWGKHGNQHPNNPSISFTLTKSCTQMSVVCQPIRDKTCSLEFYLDGIRNPEFEKKLIFYLERLLPYLPFLDALHLVIKSNNTFPHSAGIASSASSVSALALCLCSIEKEYFGTLSNVNDFLQKASFLARIGSGSACRSIFGGIALWGFVPGIANSTDELAIPIQEPVHPIFASYHDAILVIDSSPKSLSSSAGHKLMNHHAYKETRYKQASDNLQRLMAVLSSGDELKFAQIIENEALSLHGLLMSSMPGHILMHPNTLMVLKRIKEFRAQTHLPLTFTLDAGPNVHLLYSENIRTQIISFIESDLKQFCENGFWIDDQISRNR